MTIVCWLLKRLSGSIQCLWNHMTWDVKDTFLEFFIHRMPFGGLFKEDFLTNTAFSKKISEVQIDRKAFGDCVGMMCILLERLR